MMLVTGENRILFGMLKKLRLGEDRHLKAKTVDLLDFGARIKLVVSLVEGKTHVEVQVTFREDYEIHNEALDYLRSLYGPSVDFTRVDDQHKVTVSINPKEAVNNFPSPQSCARSLSKIRVQAAGAPLLNALSRMDTRRPYQNSNQETIYKLGSHSKCGVYYCISNNEKVMVVFAVSFEDEMERCLARLFLQQFEITQRKIPLTPHCEFRRSNQAPKELKSIMGNDIRSDNLPPPVGFLSFTFFPSSASSNERNLMAVDLLVNFLPYMSRHVKSTKSMMLNRMRSKRYDLLTPLKDPTHLLSW